MNYKFRKALKSTINCLFHFEAFFHVLDTFVDSRLSVFDSTGFFGFNSVDRNNFFYIRIRIIRIFYTSRK